MRLEICIYGGGAIGRNVRKFRVFDALHTKLVGSRNSRKLQAIYGYRCNTGTQTKRSAPIFLQNTTLCGTFSPELYSLYIYRLMRTCSLALYSLQIRLFRTSHSQEYLPLPNDLLPIALLSLECSSL